MFIVLDLLVAVALFGLMFVLQETGRRVSERDRRDQDRAGGGPGAAEGAVFGLLGLLIAFTFSGAAGRYDARKHLVVEEANAIGTAWLRIDFLPASAQPPLRDLFRRYVDVRIEDARTPVGNQETMAMTVDLQTRIWTSAMAAAKDSGGVAPSTVLMPALNAMIDITTTREQARRLHPPATVFVMLGILALIGSLFAGYGMAGKPRQRLHAWGFATVLSLSLFVIIDYEFPRLGFIRIDATDSVLTDVRRSMN